MLSIERSRYYFDEELGLVNKPPAFMGSHNCKCPESWSPAGLPPTVYEATQCTCTDLNDWPPQYQDGYQICNVSTVANSYIAQAARRVADIAELLGETADAAYYGHVSETIMTTLREKMYDTATGTFPDGLNGPSIAELTPSNHSAIQSIIFPMMAGVVNETAQPGMGLAMVKALKLQLKGGAGPSSCMAGFWMLQGLYRVGWEHAEAADLALEVMTSEGQYSWRNMLAQGATCTLETWPSGVAPGSGGTGESIYVYRTAAGCVRSQCKTFSHVSWGVLVVAWAQAAPGRTPGALGPTLPSFDCCSACSRSRLAGAASSSRRSRAP